jgi:hypothetical protein
MWPGRRTRRWLRRNPAPRLGQKPPLRQGTGCGWRTAAHRRRRATAAKGLRQVALRLIATSRPQPRILRPVDAAHAAGANLLQYPVRTELCFLRDCHAPQAGNDGKRIVWRKFTSLHPPTLCGNCARNGLLSVLTRAAQVLLVEKRFVSVVKRRNAS